jgi:hypothetical protein
MAEKTGVFNKLWLNTTGTTYQILEFLPGSQIGAMERIEHSGANNGSRQQSVSRVRTLSRMVQGNLQFNPTPSELDALLPWALGVAKDGSNDFILPESHTAARDVRTGRDGVFHNYTDCVVGQANFSCTEGSFLTMSVGVQGVDEESSSAPGGGDTIVAVSGSPYTINDCALTVGGDTYQFRQFQLGIEAMLEVRSNNSLTPTDIRSTGLRVSVSLGIPYGDATSLYGSGASGAAVVATFTNGSDSLRFTMPAVVFPKQPLEYGTQANMTFGLQGTAYKSSGGTALLTVRHVNA